MKIHFSVWSSSSASVAVVFFLLYWKERKEKRILWGSIGRRKCVLRLPSPVHHERRERERESRQRRRRRKRSRRSSSIFALYLFLRKDGIATGSFHVEKRRSSFQLRLRFRWRWWWKKVNFRFSLSLSCSSTSTTQRYRWKFEGFNRVSAASLSLSSLVINSALLREESFFTPFPKLLPSSSSSSIYVFFFHKALIFEFLQRRGIDCTNKLCCPNLIHKSFQEKERLCLCALDPCLSHMCVLA